jgi:hypothetical protein
MVLTMDVNTALDKGITDQRIYPWSDLGQQEYDTWMSGLLRDIPEVWEASDGAAEDIVTRYVRHLEQLVTAAYGPAGLEPDHEGVADTVDMWNQMRMLQEWLGRHMPHVRQAQGVAGPLIALLDICHSTVSTVVPVLQSIAAMVVPKLRDAGLLKRCTCGVLNPITAEQQEKSGRHHTEVCPMRTGWI